MLPVFLRDQVGSDRFLGEEVAGIGGPSAYGSVTRTLLVLAKVEQLILAVPDMGGTPGRGCPNFLIQ